jgi:hypothetical protein
MAVSERSFSFPSALYPPKAPSPPGISGSRSLWMGSPHDIAGREFEQTTRFLHFSYGDQFRVTRFPTWFAITYVIAAAHGVDAFPLIFR